MSDALRALAAAIEAVPDDVQLRLHYARLLLEADDAPQSLEHASIALQLSPTNAIALNLVTRAAAAISSISPGTTDLGQLPVEEASANASGADGLSEIDWLTLEQDIGSAIPPPFLDGTGPHLLPTEEPTLGAQGLFDVYRETITLADVGGLESVKNRIHEAFLEPLRNPEIARAFGATMRGGLLLYGPPGVGKTFLARAVAGELGAKFLSITLADILNRWFGQSEQTLHDLFQEARRLAPAVLFLDEVDAIGGKRSQYNSSGMRTIVNQLLQEMDGLGSDNAGLFILGATNHPWDVDEAMLRPGRFDRTVLVVPPDTSARESILRTNMQGKPIAGIDLALLAAHTEHYSGADLAHLVTTASEKAMTASIARGAVQPITMTEFETALAEVRPSTTTWLQSSRNVVTFANADGRYDELGAYLRSRNLL